MENFHDNFGPGASFARLVGIKLPLGSFEDAFGACVAELFFNLSRSRIGALPFGFAAAFDFAEGDSLFFSPLFSASSVLFSLSLAIFEPLKNVVIIADWRRVCCRQV